MKYKNLHAKLLLFTCKVVEYNARNNWSKFERVMSISLGATVFSLLIFPHLEGSGGHFEGNWFEIIVLLCIRKVDNIILNAYIKLERNIPIS